MSSTRAQAGAALAAVAGLGALDHAVAAGRPAGLLVDMIATAARRSSPWGDGAVTIVYNTGDAGVPRRWADADYRRFKKTSCYLYSPR